MNAGQKYVDDQALWRLTYVIARHFPIILQNMTRNTSEGRLQEFLQQITSDDPSPSSIKAFVSNQIDNNVRALIAQATVERVLSSEVLTINAQGLKTARGQLKQMHPSSVPANVTFLNNLLRQRNQGNSSDLWPILSIIGLVSETPTFLKMLWETMCDPKLTELKKTISNRAKIVEKYNEFLIETLFTSKKVSDRRAQQIVVLESLFAYALLMVQVVDMNNQGQIHYFTTQYRKAGQAADVETEYKTMMNKHHRLLRRLKHLLGLTTMKTDEKPHDKQMRFLNVLDTTAWRSNPDFADSNLTKKSGYRMCNFILEACEHLQECAGKIFVFFDGDNILPKQHFYVNPASADDVDLAGINFKTFNFDATESPRDSKAKTTCKENVRASLKMISPGVSDKMLNKMADKACDDNRGGEDDCVRKAYNETASTSDPKHAFAKRLLGFHDLKCEDEQDVKALCELRVERTCEAVGEAACGAKGPYSSLENLKKAMCDETRDALQVGQCDGRADVDVSGRKRDAKCILGLATKKKKNALTCTGAIEESCGGGNQARCFLHAILKNDDKIPRDVVDACTEFAITDNTVKSQVKPLLEQNPCDALREIALFKTIDGTPLPSMDFAEQMSDEHCKDYKNILPEANTAQGWSAFIKLCNETHAKYVANTQTQVLALKDVVARPVYDRALENLMTLSEIAGDMNPQFLLDLLVAFFKVIDVQCKGMEKMTIRDLNSNSFRSRMFFEDFRNNAKMNDVYSFVLTQKYLEVIAILTESVISKTSKFVDTIRQALQTVNDFTDNKRRIEIINDTKNPENNPDAPNQFFDYFAKVSFIQPSKPSPLKPASRFGMARALSRSIFPIEKDEEYGIFTEWKYLQETNFTTSNFQEIETCRTVVPDPIFDEFKREEKHEFFCKFMALLIVDSSKPGTEFIREGILKNEALQQYTWTQLTMFLTLAFDISSLVRDRVMLALLLTMQAKSYESTLPAASAAASAAASSAHAQWNSVGEFQVRFYNICITLTPADLLMNLTEFWKTIPQIAGANIKTDVAMLNILTTTFNVNKNVDRMENFLSNIRKLQEARKNKLTQTVTYVYDKMKDNPKTTAMAIAFIGGAAYSLIVPTSAMTLAMTGTQAVAGWGGSAFRAFNPSTTQLLTGLASRVAGLTTIRALAGKVLSSFTPSTSTVNSTRNQHALKDDMQRDDVIGLMAIHGTSQNDTPLNEDDLKRLEELFHIVSCIILLNGNEDPSTWWNQQTIKNIGWKTADFQPIKTLSDLLFSERFESASNFEDASATENEHKAAKHYAKTMKIVLGIYTSVVLKGANDKEMKERMMEARFVATFLDPETFVVELSGRPRELFLDMWQDYLDILTFDEKFKVPPQFHIGAVVRYCEQTKTAKTSKKHKKYPFILFRTKVDDDETESLKDIGLLHLFEFVSVAPASP